jgi:hypothetical protein
MRTKGGLTFDPRLYYLSIARLSAKLGDFVDIGLIHCYYIHKV